MAVRLQIRNGTASEWTSANPLLMEGELALEKDTRKFKIGNGIDNWDDLLYATQGEQGYSLDFEWSGTLLGLKKSNESVYAYKDLKGAKGDTGENLEFTWDETRLGVRVAGETSYQFIDLKGAKGDTGSVENLTSTHISTALGFAVKNLGNVDNLKQMPISGGILENYREKLTTVTGAINLNLGNVFYRNATANTTFSISNAINGEAHSFSLYIQMGATVRTLTFPASIKWAGGEIPDMTEPNKIYLLTFLSIDGGITWLGNGGSY